MHLLRKHQPFRNSFIHSKIYIAPLQGNYSEAQMIIGPRLRVSGQIGGASVCLSQLNSVFLRELCCCTVTIQRRISLRSSAQAELLVPSTRTVIRQRRAFSDGLEWSPGCAAFDASSPLGSFSL